MTTITDCLNIIFSTSDGGGEPSMGDPLSAMAGAALSIAAADGLGGEFRIIKKSYFARIRKEHPDKGGNATTFRSVQAAFDAIKAIYESPPKDTTSYNDDSILSRTVDLANNDEDGDGTNASRNVQPWEFYEAAEDVDEPLYRVELAKTGRARCSQKSDTYRQCDPDTVMKMNKKTGVEEETLQNAVIGEGEVRIGSLVEETGSYSRWMHLECWRVPSKIWLGCPEGSLGPQGSTDKQQAAAAAAASSSSVAAVSSSSSTAVSNTLYDQYETALLGMNEVFLSGIKDLPAKDRRDFIQHVMDRCNWAKLRNKAKKKKKKKADAIEDGGAEEKETGVAVPVLREDAATKPSPDALVLAATAAAANSPSDPPAVAGAMVAKAIRKDKFVPPVPGVGKAKEGALNGLKFVLTGTFPEMGGGSGLGLGKKKTEALIKSFGGTTTSSVSGKTDFLLIGKDPGMSKVSKANEKDIQRINLQQVKELCEGGSKKDIGPVPIRSFSTGFGGGNGLALKASAEELASAAAARPAQKMFAATAHADDDSDDGLGQKPAAKPAAKNKAAGKSKEKKPAAKKGSGGGKKKTAAAKKAEEKAATRKKAAENKEERKARLARSKERKETPIADLDWQSHLESGELETESVAFLKDILKQEGLKVSGKKSELLDRLREHAGLEVEGDDSDNESETSDDSSDSSDSDAMEVGDEGEEEDIMDVDEGEEMVCCGTV